MSSLESSVTYVLASSMVAELLSLQARLAPGAIMKALCWYGKGDVRVGSVADPSIREAGDIILKITSTAICGSDLHLYGGLMPTMEKGDVLGHEPMGEVVEVGSAVKKFKVGDRAVVPFTISCGDCFFCKKEMFSLCDSSNPNAEVARKAMGHSPAGLFGYSHMLGGFAGGQAEYLRVPFADIGPIKIPSGLADDQVLFLSDIFPTGYKAHWLPSAPVAVEPTAALVAPGKTSGRDRFHAI